MADTQKKYLDLEIRETDAVDGIKKLAVSIDELKAKQKEWKGTTKELTEEYIKNEAELKNAKKEYNQQIGVLGKVQQAQKDTSGSLKSLKNQLSINTDKWNRLSEKERLNSDAGKKLTAEKKRLTAALLKEEKATGDATRQVGQYEKGAGNATTTTGRLKAGALLAAAAIYKIGQKLSGTVKNIIMSTQKGDFFANEMNGMKTATNTFFKAIATGDWSNLLDNMKDAYDEGVRYAAQLDRIYDKQNATSIRLSELRTKEAIALELLKDKTGDLETRTKAMNDLVEIKKQITAEEGVIAKDKYDNDLKNLTEISGLKEQEIKDLFVSIDLQDKAAAAAEKRERIRARNSKHNAAARGNSVIKDNQKYYDDLQKNFSEEERSLRRINEGWQKITDSTEENVMASRDSFTAVSIGLNDVNTKFVKSKTELVLYKAQLQKLIEGEEERKDVLVENSAATIAAIQAEMKEFHGMHIDKMSIRSADNKQKLADDKLVADQSNQIVLDSDVEFTAKRLANKAKYQSDLFNAEQTFANENEITRIEADQLAFELDYERAIMNANAIGADTADIEASYMQIKKELAMQEFQAKAGLAADFANNIATIAGKNSKVGKAAAATAAVISTLQGATAAFASLAPIPIVGPALGGAAAAAALVSGYANVKKIYQTKSGLPGDSGGGGGTPGGSTPSTPAIPTNVTAELGKGLVNRDLQQNNASNDPRMVLVVDDVTEAQGTEDRINDVSSF